MLPVLVAAAALVLGAALGFLLGQARAAKRIESLRVELEGARVRLEAGARQEAERLALLEQSEARLRASFDSLAGETLRANSELFLQVAREALGRDQAIAQSSLKERETAIAQLIEPLRAAIERTEQQAQALERERREAYSSLRTQIESLASGQGQLQRETRNLVMALRRPEVRGRWGELTLRRLVELAGLSEHCDFTEQLHLFGPEGALRPDLVVHMPITSISSLMPPPCRGYCRRNRTGPHRLSVCRRPLSHNAGRPVRTAADRRSRTRPPAPILAHAGRCSPPQSG